MKSEFGHFGMFQNLTGAILPICHLLQAILDSVILGITVLGGFLTQAFNASQ